MHSIGFLFQSSACIGVAAEPNRNLLQFRFAIWKRLFAISQKKNLSVPTSQNPLIGSQGLALARDFGSVYSMGFLLQVCRTNDTRFILVPIPDSESIARDAWTVFLSSILNSHGLSVFRSVSFVSQIG